MTVGGTGPGLGGIVDAEPVGDGVSDALAVALDGAGVGVADTLGETARGTACCGSSAKTTTAAAATSAAPAARAMRWGLLIPKR